jgi:uncharacterized protein YqjF (DUF2071 family)
MRMRWVDLLFAHWPVEIDAIRRLIPHDLEIDTYEGQAYLGIVPFRMEDVAPRGLPAPPRFGSFSEVNVRTYVRYRDRPGVWFQSLDAASRLAVEGARAAFHLPYFHASMAVDRDGDTVRYRSDRRDRRGPSAALEVRYRPTGAPEYAPAGTLDAWLTDRLRLFAVDGRGRVLRTEIRHAPWPLRPATAEFSVESLAAAQGIDLPLQPSHVRFVDRLDVVAWWPRHA